MSNLDDKFSLSDCAVYAQGTNQVLEVIPALFSHYKIPARPEYYLLLRRPIKYVGDWILFGMLMKEALDLLQKNTETGFIWRYDVYAAVLLLEKEEKNAPTLH